MIALCSLVNGGSDLTKKCANDYEVRLQDLEIKSLQHAWRSIWAKSNLCIGVHITNNC